MQSVKTTWLAGLIDPLGVCLCHVEEITGVSRPIAWARVEKGRLDTSATLLEALAELERSTGSRYLDDKGNLMFLRAATGWGCDGMAVCYGAVRPLRVLVAGLTETLSVEAARRALQTTPAEEVGLVIAHPGLDASEVADTLVRTRPDVVLLVGGTDRGARAPVEALARYLMRGMERLPREHQPTVLCAANPDVCADLPSEWVGASLPNVLPDANTLRWQTVAETLRTLHTDILLADACYGQVRSWTGHQYCLAPDEVARRLLRFWCRRHGLRSAAGGWWLGEALLYLRVQDGRSFLRIWDATKVTMPALPDPLAERAVAAAVWSEDASAHGRSGRLSRLAAARRRSGTTLWIDDAGLSLALGALAAQAGRAGAQALLLDGLVAASP